MNNMAPTLFCSPSRTLPSSLTSLIDDIEPVVRPVLLTPAVEDLVVVGGFVPAEGMVCPEVTGVFLMPEDTEVRGFAEGFVAVPVSVGDTTACREEVVGFVEMDAETDLEIWGAEVLDVGAMDDLRVGAEEVTVVPAVPVVAGFDGDIFALVGEAAGPLTDFLSEDVADTLGLGVVDEVAETLVVGADLRLPVPKVPELIIWNMS